MNFGYNFHDREMIRIIVFDINPPEIVYQNRGLALPFTHKIGLDNGVPAVYVFRHELTKPNQTDPFEV